MEGELEAPIHPQDAPCCFNMEPLEPAVLYSYLLCSED
jgi:hypothetical protein